MKVHRQIRTDPEPGHRHHRRGYSAKEVVLSTFVVLSFTMGMYFLGERCFSRLYHFISTMTGSPYL